MNWLDLVVLSIVVYRITRFISLDSLIEEPRDWVERWLLSEGTYIEDDEHWPVGYWRRKGVQWLRCPYCQSVWVAAGTLGLWCLVVVNDWTGWQFLFDWLALAGASMLLYRYTDPSPPCLPTKQCE